MLTATGVVDNELSCLAGPVRPALLVQPVCLLAFLGHYCGISLLVHSYIYSDLFTCFCPEILARNAFDFAADHVTLR